MSRIKNAFNNKKAFIAFLTAGDPSIEKTEEFILELVNAGTDLIEIGIPFSDPIAEGPVIQDATIRALKSGTTIDKIFNMVASVRKKTDVPIVLLSYINILFHYKYDKFFEMCNHSGVDGVIIPDIPFEEKQEVEEVSSKYGVDIISLVAPTSENRIKMITEKSEGFLYLVSSMGVTGIRNEINTDLKPMIDAIKFISDIPVAVGFGINTEQQASEISKIADGIIVGSAIVKIIEKYSNNAGPYLYQYAELMKNAMS